ncbi:MAG: DUF456 domain-containing protein [Paludibacteraceae bacterium]|nr:DUF456 domain-containing protein [Paludibacteraceae bacterium]
MEIFLLVIAGLCILLGIVGCIIPGIPGLPLAYAGLLVAQITERVDFSWQTLLIWGVITIVLQVLDYMVPVWGTKHFGGTNYGSWGSMIGLLIGLFGGTLGVILGPLIGAVVGELLGGKSILTALKSGWGSFLGIFFSTVAKLICIGFMTVMFINAVWG